LTLCKLSEQHKAGMWSKHALCRYPPFFDEDVTNTYKKIVKGVFAFPSYFPVTARDLVRKLLQVSCIGLYKQRNNGYLYWCDTAFQL